MLWECHSEVEQEDEERKDIVQQILQRSALYQPKDREGSHCRTCALAVIGIRWKTTSGGPRQGTATATTESRNSAPGGALRVRACTAGGSRTDSWSQDSADPGEAKVCRAQGPPQGACENLVCALKMSAAGTIAVRACVVANATGETRAESWSYRMVRIAAKQRFSERMLHHMEEVTA